MIKEYMIEFCNKCGGLVVKLVFPHCNYDFRSGAHCLFYRKRLYTREDAWEWEGEGCAAVYSFDHSGVFFL